MNRIKLGFRNLHLPILFILLIGVIGGLTFTSCSSTDGDDEQPSQSGGGSSSSTGGGGGGSSSSGGGGGSSSSGHGHFNPDITYGSFIDSRDNKTYRSVVIGDQTWMAENLNYDVPNNATDVCHSNNPDNCAIYGRMYDWETAMAVCPDGWHLPSSAEWTVLTNYVGSNAGTKLKSTTGWSNKGTDDYGFSALPGNYYDGSNDRFRNIGDGGDWWSSTESSSVNSPSMGISNIAGVMRNNYSKSNKLSVRCVKDDNSSGGGSSSSVGGSYPFATTIIGNQVWMAKNLDTNVLGSTCYGDDPANCATYGRLYDWATAMNIPSSCNDDYCSGQIQSKHRGICPSGWHIPSNEDWDELFFWVDTQNDPGSYYDGSTYDSFTAGRYLKATSGWMENGNGTNEYGFSALPGGWNNYAPHDGWYEYEHAGGIGYWWSSSELYNDDPYNDVYTAYGRSMYYANDNAFWFDYVKGSMLSVRCLRDE